MPLVVLLRGLNVGGHRRFRPSLLARQLRHLGAVNIGATGTFLVRNRVSRTALRREIARRLPFDAEIMICESRDLVRLLSHTRQRFPTGTVRFMSVLSRTPRSAPRLPITLPKRGRWLVKLLRRDGRYVVGVYRRHMKVIGHLGSLDRIFGVPATTRSWSTLTAIARLLEAPRSSTR
jgi:uncharacterized protein (DUF1697 family)